jgi:hypothetical protein
LANGRRLPAGAICHDEQAYTSRLAPAVRRKFTAALLQADAAIEIIIPLQ